MNSERAFSQGIESDSNRRPSARGACALTTMLPRPVVVDRHFINHSSAFLPFFCCRMPRPRRSGNACMLMMILFLHLKAAKRNQDKDASDSGQSVHHPVSSQERQL